MSKLSFVVMSNDYPDAVFSAEHGESDESVRARAAAYVRKRMQEQRDAIALKYTGDYKPPPRISYRAYEFTPNVEGCTKDWRSMYA